MSKWSRFLGQVFGVGLALGATSFCTVLIVSGVGWIGTRDTAPTRLEVKMGHLSEIHQALATPIPPPDRLPPITERPTRALARTIVSLRKVERRRPIPALSEAAREAQAALEPAPVSIVRVLHDEPKFSEMFMMYLLARNSRVEEDLVDQLFNSSEKRLARVLLLMANFGKEGKPEPVIAKIRQETLAEMVGTTRSRISSFTLDPSR